MSWGYPDTKTRQGHYRERKLPDNIPDEHRYKKLNKIWTTQIHDMLKKLYTTVKCDLLEMQRWFKSTNQSMWYSTLTKWNIKITWSFARCRKRIWQNSTFVYNKNSQQSGYREKYLNIIKAIYNKPLADIALDGEDLKTWPNSKIRNKIRTPTLASFIQHSTEVLATTTGQNKQTNKNPRQKKASKSESKKWNCPYS